MNIFLKTFNNFLSLTFFEVKIFQLEIILNNAAAGTVSECPIFHWKL